MGAGNQGFFFVRLKPRDQRALSVDQIIAELRPKVATVPGVMTFMQNPPPITVSGQDSISVYQMTLQSANLKEIYPWVPRLVDEDAHAARVRGRQLATCRSPARR